MDIEIGCPLAAARVVTVISSKFWQFRYRLWIVCGATPHSGESVSKTFSLISGDCSCSGVIIITINITY